MNQEKTRAFSGKADWTCPRHNKTVTNRKRFQIDDDTGRKKFAGDHLACPDYPECGYYIGVTTLAIPVMVEGPDGKLVAVGRLEDPSDH